MNIFFTSNDPVECAQHLDDKRLNKMIIESAQMLSTAIDRHGGKAPYRVAWKKHPCTIWTGETRSNYEWHIRLLLAMSEEYTHRYGKIHKTYSSTFSILDSQKDLVQEGPLTDFPNCSLRKDVENVIQAYRLGFLIKWSKDKIKPRWTNRQRPTWLLELTQAYLSNQTI
jgi:hypothetical protein